MKNAYLDRAMQAVKSSWHDAMISAAANVSYLADNFKLKDLKYAIPITFMTVGYGCRDDSNNIITNTEPDNQKHKIEAPSSLDAQAYDDVLDIKWTKVKGADGYKIALAEDCPVLSKTGQQREIADVIDTAYVYEGALPEKFSVDVRAYSNDGSESQPTSRCVGRINPPGPRTPPAKPSNASAWKKGANQVDVLWQDNSNNEVGFVVYRNGVPRKIVSKNTIFYSDNGISAVLGMPYSIRAIGDGASDTAGTVVTLLPPADTMSISGVKFEDVNNNGVKDAGELGLPNWQIKLNGSITDTTESDGNYKFLNLAAGTYSVTEVLQSGWTQTRTPGPVSVVQGIHNTGADFGNFRLGSISGMKFEDQNINGAKDGGEPGVPDVDIYIDANSNGAKDAGEAGVKTGSDGTYSFSNLLAGNYKIREVAPSGWAQSTTNPSDISISTSDTSVNNVDFGNYRPGKISGVKYNDKNNNATKDAGEPGLPGWEIFIDANSNGVKDVGEQSSTTIAGGAYSFSNLTSGSYTVREVMKTEWTQSSANPADININTSNQDVQNVNFGNKRPFTISGAVIDAYDNSALSGVKVKVTHENTGKADSVTTGAGSYTLVFNSAAPDTDKFTIEASRSATPVYSYKELAATLLNSLIDTIRTTVEYTDPDNAGSSDSLKEALPYLNYMHITDHFLFPGVTRTHRWRNQDRRRNVYIDTTGTPKPSSSALSITRNAIAEIESRLGEDRYQEVSSSPQIGIDIVYDTTGGGGGTIDQWTFDNNNVALYPVRARLSLMIDGSGNPRFNKGIVKHELGHIELTTARHDRLLGRLMTTAVLPDFSNFEIRNIFKTLYGLPLTIDKKYLLSKAGSPSAPEKASQARNVYYAPDRIVKTPVARIGKADFHRKMLER